MSSTLSCTDVRIPIREGEDSPPWIMEYQTSHCLYREHIAAVENPSSPAVCVSVCVCVCVSVCVCVYLICVYVGKCMCVCVCVGGQLTIIIWTLAPRDRCC